LKAEHETASAAARLETERFRKKVAAIHKREKDVLPRAGKLFSDLFDVYTELAAIEEERDAVDGEYGHSFAWTLLNQVERDTWQEFIQPKTRPFPMDFERFLLALHEAMFDPGSKGYRSEALEPVFDMATGDMVASSYRPPRLGNDPEQSLLVSTPDRRGELRRPSLSARDLSLRVQGR
jgi:hypothetical protein